MLVLIHPNGEPLTKSFRWDGNNFVEHPKRFLTYYGWQWFPVKDLNSLSKTLIGLESQTDRMVIRGLPASDINEDQLIRRKKNLPSGGIRSNPCQWLCIDIDGLEFPDGLNDFNRFPTAIAKYAASMLLPEFQRVDFHFQFSSSMGIKEGIRIHLWFWLGRPISDTEAKIWVSQSKVNVDLSLYTPVQPHYTAAPIFDPEDADPVKMRSGLIEYENGMSAVPVPDDLDHIAKEQTRNKTTRLRTVDADGRLDGDRVVRNAEGLVIDGREQFLFHKSLQAIRELTKGQKNPEQFDDLDALTDLTWAWFSNEADLSDGKWTIEKARERAQGRIADIRAGKLRLGRDKKITLIPVEKPYFDFSSVDADTGTKQINAALDEFFQGALSGDGNQRKLALRITMGSGKTTATITHLKQAFKAKPDLNVEIYVPRHDLIDEMVRLLEGTD